MDTVDQLAVLEAQEQSLRHTVGPALLAVSKVKALGVSQQQALVDGCLLPASQFFDAHVEILQDPPSRGRPARGYVHVPHSGATSLRSGTRAQGGQCETAGTLLAYDVGQLLDAILPHGKGGAWTAVSKRYDDGQASLWVQVVHAAATCVAHAVDGAIAASDCRRVKLRLRGCTERTAKDWVAKAQELCPDFK